MSQWLKGARLGKRKREGSAIQRESRKAKCSHIAIQIARIRARIFALVLRPDDGSSNNEGSLIYHPMKIWVARALASRQALLMFAGVLALAISGFSQEARSSSRPISCDCPDAFSPDVPAGVVWTGSTGIRLPEIARLLAPVLWFSSDEPLLVYRDGDKIPHAHPCDRESSEPVVYYQATDIVLRGKDRVLDLADNDGEFFEKVDNFVLRYFFYYDEDWGLGRHKHDLEVVNLYVSLERQRGGCARVRVSRIEGLAHGLDWYSNVQRVEKDTVFPPVILVEEGKHASCPDRNGDGIYTPGYDVNVRVNDAWGVRDVLGSSVLLGSGYRASMSKPREPQFRLFPPQSPLQRCTAQDPRDSQTNPSMGRYELRSAMDVPKCSYSGAEPDRLQAMMRSHRFGEGAKTGQYGSNLERELSDPRNRARWISAINARLQSKNVGILIQGPGYNAREVWAVPRVFYSRNSWFVDALVTPSASRWADWYAAAGFERVRRNPAEAPGRENQFIRGFGSEIGMKFRVAVPGKLRWALLGYRFGGLRIGVRTNGISRLQEPRLVIELGAGVF